MMLDEYYRQNPDLRELYLQLPGAVRMHILENNVRVTTKGELQKLAAFWEKPL